jgi:hypothetical protein
MPRSSRKYFLAILVISAVAHAVVRAALAASTFSPYTSPPLARHASGDFDGDGRLDVARIQDESSPQISVWLSGNASPVRLDAAVTVLVDDDVDDDGDLDLVATTANNDVLIWLNDGHGRFTREEPIHQRGFSSEAAMTTADAGGQPAIGLTAAVVDAACRDGGSYLVARRIRPQTPAIEFELPSLRSPSLRAPPSASI